MNYESAMHVALERARFGAVASGDVPVGAVILNSKGEIVAMGNNQRELLRDPIAHAEMVAIRAAARSFGSWRLEECTLVVTLEPCAMCAGAIMQSRIQELYSEHGMRKREQQVRCGIYCAILDHFIKLKLSPMSSRTSVLRCYRNSFQSKGSARV